MIERMQTFEHGLYLVLDDISTTNVMQNFDGFRAMISSIDFLPDFAVPMLLFFHPR